MVNFYHHHLLTIIHQLELLKNGGTITTTAPGYLLAGTIIITVFVEVVVMIVDLQPFQTR
jgi:hypothetical protein